MDAYEVSLPCSISVLVNSSLSDRPVWSFVVIYFGPATLDPSLSVGGVPPDHSPDGYLQQSVCPELRGVHCLLALQRVGAGGGMVDTAPTGRERRLAVRVRSCPSIHFL